ncbi:hypothetical protein MMC14_009316 [Varicellaria rhodocarpa]|nr:hypothetical protein [Varicellaria rhodocarpa]
MASENGVVSGLARTSSFPPTPDNWNFIWSLFIRLYIDEKKTLNEVRRILDQEHGFRATKKICNQRIITWNIQKNYKASEKEEAARILRTYKDDGFKDTGKRYPAKVPGRNF